MKLGRWTRIRQCCQTTGDTLRSCPRSARNPRNRVYNEFSVGNGFGRFLRQVVTDAARDGPMRVHSDELLRIRCRFRMGCAVRIAFEADRRHGDDRRGGKLPFQRCVWRLAARETQSPTVVVDYDRHVIRVKNAGDAG